MYVELSHGLVGIFDAKQVGVRTYRLGSEVVHFVGAAVVIRQWGADEVEKLSPAQESTVVGVGMLRVASPSASAGTTLGELLLWASKRTPYPVGYTVEEDPPRLAEDWQPCCGWYFNRVLIRDAIQPLVESGCRAEEPLALGLVSTTATGKSVALRIVGPAFTAVLMPADALRICKREMGGDHVPGKWTGEEMTNGQA